MKHFFQYFYFLFLFCLVINACRTPTKDCAEAEATNFNPLADQNCCCQYPNLVLTIDHRLDTSTRVFDLNTDYLLPSGDSIRFLQFRYFVSDFLLKSNTQDTISVRDTVLGSINKGMGLINKGGIFTFDNPVGKFQKVGKYDSLFFRIGFNTATLATKATQYPTGHQLAPQTDSMTFKGRFLSHKIVYVKGKNLKDTVRISIAADTEGTKIALPISVTTVKGFNTNPKIRVNYFDFFKNINLQTDDSATIAQKIKTNSANVFR